jgi:photosystem II stability/assembly factor-like uncharacterized protein
MKNTVFLLTVILILSSLYFSQPINAQWIKQNSGSTNNIRDVYFLNLNTGWACGDTKIYKTTNGGLNWVTQSNPAINYIEQIHAVDSNIVYAAGWYTLLKSTNGGTNWIGIMTGTFGSGLPVFEGLYFLNANTGWLCGSLQIQKTTDGGLTFDSVYVSAELTDIYFKNELEGVSSGEYTIYRTSNGGQSWVQSIIKDEWRQMFLRVSFVNSNTGFVVGSSNTLKTTNFGISWDSVGRIISDQHIYSSIFTSENIGYAGGTYGVLFKTTNGGHTWGFQDTTGFGNGFIRSFWAYNDSILWAVGGNGKILHTTTGGQWLVGINNITTEVPKGFVLYQNYPNPFNPTTNIKFSITKTEQVKLIVYDVRGCEVRTLVNENLQSGMYETKFDGNSLSSGVYFYKLITNDYTETKKMLLIK